MFTDPFDGVLDSDAVNGFGGGILRITIPEDLRRIFAPRRTLCDNVTNQVCALDSGQLDIQTVEPVRQILMIDTELMQYRRV